MNESSSEKALVNNILNEVESLLIEAEKGNQPLELDPHRSKLFDLFVTAEGAGLVQDEEEGPLTADELCRQIAQRWGLDQAAQSSTAQQTPMSQDHVQKMRILWSAMRLWMEWCYAWKRWPEFHTEK